MNDATERPQARTRRQHSGVRIEDVARHAGVSAITVSRALNKPDSVAEPTRKLVWAAIDALGYIPNQLAGGLASSRTRTIGIVIPTIVNSIFADKIQGMTDVLGAAGYQLILANSGYSLEQEAEFVAAMLAQRPSALVLTGVTHDARAVRMLGRAGVPVVETWNLRDDPIDLLVGFSNEDASFAMVEHLAHCGYRRIGFVCAPVEHNDRAADRLKGFRRGIAQFGLADRPGLVREAHFSLENGADALLAILDAHPDVEAIFFANDILAAGGMLEALRRGIRVPHDIGIAGFDDVDLAQKLIPALTTVRIPRYEIGATAARMILRRLKTLDEQPDPPVGHIEDLGFDIIPRQSTRHRL